MAEQEIATPEGAIVKIDGVEHKMDDLNETARAQVQSLRFVDAELARLNAQIAVANTARNAYLRALREAVTTPEA